MSLFENVLLGFNPHQVASEFEAVIYAKNGTGHPYFDGFFLKSDIESASPKFQKALNSYKYLANISHCLLTEGPTFGLWCAYNKLMRRSKKEKIKYYSVEEYKDYVEKINVKELEK